MSVSAAEFRSAEELAQTVESAGFALRSCSSHLDGLVTVLAAIAK